MMQTKKISFLIVFALFLAVLPTATAMADEGSTVYLPLAASPISPSDALQPPTLEVVQSVVEFSGAGKLKSRSTSM